MGSAQVERVDELPGEGGEVAEGVGVVDAVGPDVTMFKPGDRVWAMAAFLLNFLPYIGAALTIILVTIISLITFPSFAFALVAPAYVLACDIIEGQFVTPVVVGRRLES